MKTRLRRESPVSMGVHSFGVAVILELRHTLFNSGLASVVAKAAKFMAEAHTDHPDWPPREGAAPKKNK